MTELQFLIDLLLNHKIQKATKDLIAKRIGEVENGLAQPVVRGIATQSLPRLVNGVTQAASTIAAMERHANPDAVPITTPIELAPVAPLPANALATNRIVGGEVNTGRGSRGPRKF